MNLLTVTVAALAGAITVSTSPGAVSPLTGKPMPPDESSSGLVESYATSDAPGRFAPCTPGVLYGTDSGSLYTVDTSTGAATLVGSHGTPAAMGGLAIDATGALFSMSIGSTPELFSIDPGSGTATVIGQLGIGFVFEGGLNFSQTGLLYGVDQGDAGSALSFTIDPVTGAATVFGTPASGLRDLNGIAFDGTTLYGLEQTSGSLGTIDLVTGQFSQIGSTLATVGVAGGLTVDPETCDLYAYLDGGPGLHTLDKTTGAATFIGPNIVNYGLDFCPTSGGCVPCAVLDLIAVSPLLGAKERPDGAHFSWASDPKATEYHLNAVTMKQGLLDPRLPPGAGEGRCLPVPIAPALDCLDPITLTDPRSTLYYQLLSACGSSADDEGPF